MKNSGSFGKGNQPPNLERNEGTKAKGEKTFLIPKLQKFKSDWQKI